LAAWQESFRCSIEVSPSLAAAAAAMAPRELSVLLLVK
jgi:hypothetical protein